MRYKRLPELAERMIYRDDIPKGAYPVEAWVMGNELFITIEHIPEDEAHLHNCDKEGCGSFSHVIRFQLPNKEREG